jgi:hypothetical protein
MYNVYPVASIAVPKVVNRYMYELFPIELGVESAVEVTHTL